MIRTILDPDILPEVSEGIDQIVFKNAADHSDSSEQGEVAIPHAICPTKSAEPGRL